MESKEPGFFRGSTVWIDVFVKWFFIIQPTYDGDDFRLVMDLPC